MERKVRRFPCSTTPTTKTRSLSMSVARASASPVASSYTSKSREARDLRLLYVALTRARHQAVVWWAGSHQQRQFAARPAAVLPRRRRGRVVARGDVPRRRTGVGTARKTLPGTAGGCIGVESADGHEGATLELSVETSPELEAAVFDRVFDERWRRTSYSGITADAHDPGSEASPTSTSLPTSPRPAIESFAAEGRRAT